LSFSSNKNRIKIPLINEKVINSTVKTSEKLFIHPYVMGALLGDGNLTDGSIRFSSSDEEILKRIEGLLAPNYKIQKVTGSKYDYRIQIKRAF